jgi:hypothetical protein
MSNSEEPADFAEDLADAKEWEEFAVERVEELLLSTRATNVSYDERPKLQRAGIDGILTESRPSFDVKVQDYRHTDTGNLPVEVWSSIDDQVPGWFYTAESDLIVWLYKNRANTDLYHTGYLMPLRGSLVEWFNDRVGDFRRVTTRNRGMYGDEYTTVCRLAPIEEFPAEYLAEFDPRLPTDRDTPQSDLSEWAEVVDR